LCDKDQQDLLHIEASHGLTVDAIDTFFDGQNSTMERTDLKVADGTPTYETLHKNIGIWWKWIDKEKKHVLVWSCFKRY
jgi:hypothetical protein